MHQQKSKLWRRNIEKAIWSWCRQR